MVLRKNIRGFFILLGLSALLSGCTPGMPIDEQDEGIFHFETVMPDNFSFLELGRSLSAGAVDLFDPDLDYFEPALMEEDNQEKVSMEEFLDFPLSGYYKPEDPEVTFYALTLGTNDLEVKDPSPVMMPVPLKAEDK